MSNIKEFESRLKSATREVSSCKNMLDKLRSSATSTSSSEEKLSKITSDSAKAFKSLGDTVKGTVKDIFTFDGIVNVLGFSIGGKLVGATLAYNKTLFELSQQAKVSGRSFSEMKMAIDGIASSTALAEDQAASLFLSLSTGLKGVTVTKDMAISLANAFSVAFGPSMEDAARGTKLLSSFTEKLPALLSQVKSSMPIKEFDELLKRQIFGGKINAQEARDLSALHRAHLDGKNALTAEAAELQKLNEIKADFEKGFRQFLLAVGKPLSDVLKNFGTYIKPVFEYITKALKDKNVQDFIKLLIAGKAVSFGAKSIGNIVGGAGGFLSSMNPFGAGRKKQDVNIDTISGQSAASVLARSGVGGAGGVGMAAGGIKNYLSGFADRLAPASMLYAGSSLGGEYLKNKYASGDENKNLRARLDALETTGKATAVGYGVAGAPGAAVAAVATTAGEVGNLLSTLIPQGAKIEAFGKTLEFGGDASISFAENVKMAMETIYDSASGTSGTTDRRRKAEEESINAVSRTKQNMDMLDKRFSELSDESKKSLGISSEETEFQQKEKYKAMMINRLAEHGGKASDLSGGAVGFKRIEKELIKKGTESNANADEMSFAESRDILYRSTLAVSESMLAKTRSQLELSVKWGDSVENVLSYSKEINSEYEKQQASLREQLKNSSDKVAQNEATLKTMRAAEKSAIDAEALLGRKLAENNTFTQERMSAEAGLNIEKQTEADLIAKITSLEIQRKDNRIAIKQSVDAEVQANQTLIDYEIQFRGNAEAVNKLVANNLAMYGQSIAAYRAIKDEIVAQLNVQQSTGASAKDISKTKAEIHRIDSLIVETLGKQNTAYEESAKLIERKRSIIDSSIALEEANLQLNQAINGGLGATLEVRSRLYENNENAIRQTKSLIDLYSKQYQAALKDGTNKRGTLDLEQKLIDAKAKQVQYVLKQVELTKSLRDGYLDALTTFTQVEGTFSKIVMTRENGLGEAMRRGTTAQGFTMGSIGGGLESPIFKRNPDGSITTPGSGLLNNLFKGMEKNYDSKRPAVLGVESVGAGVLKDSGYETQFTSGQFGPKSQMYGNTDSKNGVLNIATGDQFKKTNPSVDPYDNSVHYTPPDDSSKVDPETVQREEKNIKNTEKAIGAAISSSNEKVVELLQKISSTLQDMKNMSDISKKMFNGPSSIGKDVVSSTVVSQSNTSKGADRFEKTNELDWTNAQIAETQANLKKNPNDRDQKDLLKYLQENARQIKEELLTGSTAQVDSTKEVKNAIDKSLLNQKEQTEAIKKNALQISKEALTSKPAQSDEAKKISSYNSQYREMIARDAFARNKVWEKSNSAINNNALNTSGVGGKGAQYNTAAIERNEQQASERDRKLAELTNKLNDSKKKLPEQHRLGGWVGMSDGGGISGYGGGDTQKVLAERGEFVVNKEAAREYPRELAAINMRKYEDGGQIGVPNEFASWEEKEKKRKEDVEVKSETPPVPYAPSGGLGKSGTISFFSIKGEEEADAERSLEKGGIGSGDPASGIKYLPEKNAPPLANPPPASPSNLPPLNSPVNEKNIDAYNNASNSNQERYNQRMRQAGNDAERQIAAERAKKAKEPDLRPESVKRYDIPDDVRDRKGEQEYLDNIFRNERLTREKASADSISENAAARKADQDKISKIAAERKAYEANEAKKIAVRAARAGSDTVESKNYKAPKPWEPKPQTPDYIDYPEPVRHYRESPDPMKIIDPLLDMNPFRGMNLHIPGTEVHLPVGQAIDAVRNPLGTAYDAATGKLKKEGVKPSGPWTGAVKPVLKSGATATNSFLDNTDPGVIMKWASYWAKEGVAAPVRAFSKAVGKRDDKLYQERRSKAQGKGDAREIAREIADKYAKAKKHAAGGEVLSENSDLRRMASGGRLPGYGGGDKVPILAERGEWVINKDAVLKAEKKYPGLLGNINAKKYAEGGVIGSASIAASSSSGSPSIMFNIKGDSAKNILTEANNNLSNVLDDMMGGLSSSSRYYDVSRS